jgi:hypothetical protein
MDGNSMILTLATPLERRMDLPDGGVVSVDISVHDVVAGDSAKVFEILTSSQDWTETTDDHSSENP